jgi:acetate kinase
LSRGGDRFARSILVDEGVSASLESLENPAPRQNAAGLAGLREARALLGRGTPLVAVFDDAFHATMPERACLYALPRENGRRPTVRRHGSHGISYRHLVERYSLLTGVPAESTALVAFHLGRACSAAAIAGGRSIDTSAGFSTLEGLVTATGCGDLDPSMVGHLARVHGMSLEAVERFLGEKSGLLGLSGVSEDLRELVARESSGPSARLAVDLFIYRARKYLGAYLAALGGADAVVFSGGIGENLPSIRQRICEGAEWCGLLLDPAANRRAVGVEAEIGARGSRMRAFVIPTDEEGMIARETAACLQLAARGGATRAG